MSVNQLLVPNDLNIFANTITLANGGDVGTEIIYVNTISQYTVGHGVSVSNTLTAADGLIVNSDAVINNGCVINGTFEPTSGVSLPNIPSPTNISLSWYQEVSPFTIAFTGPASPSTTFKLTRIGNTTTLEMTTAMTFTTTSSTYLTSTTIIIPYFTPTVNLYFFVTSSVGSNANYPLVFAVNSNGDLLFYYTGSTANFPNSTTVTINPFSVNYLIS